MKEAPCNWPASLARLIVQKHTEARSVFPVSTSRSSLECSFIWLNEVAILVLQLGVRNLVTLGISILNVTDRAFNALNGSRNTLVALATQTRWPFNRLIYTDFTLESAAYLGQVVSKQESGT